MATKHICHNCDKRGLNHSMCAGCNFSIYCGNECYEDHHKCEISKHEIWTRQNVREMKKHIDNRHIQSRIDSFLRSNQDVPDNELKADIVNQMYIDGKLTEYYMKVLLRTAKGRENVMKKLVRSEDMDLDELRWYQKTKYYNAKQRQDIVNVVNSTNKKGDYVWDPDGSFRDYFEKRGEMPSN